MPRERTDSSAPRRRPDPVDLVPDGVCLVDRDGHIVRCNQAFASLLGQAAAQLVGRSCDELFPPSESDTVPLFRQALAGGARVTGEVGADSRSFRVTADPIRGADGEIAEVICYVAEAGAPARAHEERLHDRLLMLEIVTDRAAEALFLMGAEGYVTYLNPAATEMFGWTRAELAGKRLHDAIHYQHPDGAPYPAGECPLVSVLSTGRAVHNHEDTFYRRDGSPVTVRCSNAPVVKDGRIAGAVLVVSDISERKRLEEELRVRAEQLAEAGRRKDQFLAALAHELRNPLAAMLNGVELTEQPGVAAEVHERVRAMLGRQLRHLARLVDDLLETSRLVHGRVLLRPERLDLARLVVTAAEDRRPVFERAGLTLTVEAPETPVWVRGDPTRLAQVLDNLLDNAARFTVRGGRVDVRLMVDPRRRQALAAVRDNGAGIEPGMLGRLWEVFSQADDSLDRPRGGLGLGLSVVKSLVELHGGEVTAASAGPGQGAEFTFRLPVEEEPPALAIGPAPVQPTRERRRVLIVEDNRDAADCLRLLLELLGHEIRVAYTGPDGVEAARNWAPDVVVCDIGLPGLDGYGVARELRLHPRTAHVRLLALTGYGSEEDRRRSRQAGFDEHLTKPIEPDVLVSFLTRLDPPPAGGSAAAPASR